jgi:hypothetical protein
MPLTLPELLGDINGTVTASAAMATRPVTMEHHCLVSPLIWSKLSGTYTATVAGDKGCVPTLINELATSHRSCCADIVLNCFRR